MLLEREGDSDDSVEEEIVDGGVTIDLLVPYRSFSEPVKWQ